MFPLLGSLITGGAGLLGSMFSSDSAKDINAANIRMQQETNQMNIAENQKNREFQEQMSSTAYQRANQDMQKAGLNPMMMFGSGSAASSPGGSVPNLQAPRATENPGKAFEGLGHVVSNAINAGVSAKTMDKMTEEMANLIAENARIKASTGLTQQSTKTEEFRSMTENAESILRASGIPQATIDRLEKEGVLKYLDKETLKKIGIGEYGLSKVSKALDNAVPFISGAKSAIKHLHEWKGPSTTGLSPSQTKNLYDKFKAMSGE